MLEITFVAPDLLWGWLARVRSFWIVGRSAICFPDIGKLGGCYVGDCIVLIEVNYCHVDVVGKGYVVG